MRPLPISPASTVLSLPDPIHPERKPCRCKETFRSPAAAVLELPDPLHLPQDCGCDTAPTEGA